MYICSLLPFSYYHCSFAVLECVLFNNYIIGLCKVNIRESVDSLCRDDADTPITQYIKNH